MVKGSKQTTSAPRPAAQPEPLAQPDSKPEMSPDERAELAKLRRENIELRRSQDTGLQAEIGAKTWVRCRTTKASYGPQYEGTQDIRRYWRPGSTRFFPADNIPPFAIPWKVAKAQDDAAEAARERGEPQTLSRLARSQAAKSPVEAQAERARKFKAATGGKLPVAVDSPEEAPAATSEAGAVPRVPKPPEQPTTVRGRHTPVD